MARTVFNDHDRYLDTYMKVSSCYRAQPDLSIHLNILALSWLLLHR